MMKYRREYLGLCCSLSLLAGCADENASSDTKIVLGLNNGSDERKTFHFVLEGPDGIGDWITRDLSAGDSESMVLSSDDEQQWETYYGILDDTLLSGQLISPETSSCIKLKFLSEFGDSDEPEILQDGTEEC